MDGASLMAIMAFIGSMGGEETCDKPFLILEFLQELFYYIANFVSHCRVKNATIHMMSISMISKIKP